MSDVLARIEAYKRQEIAAAKEAVPQAEIERQEEYEALVGALGSLNERDRLVISLYYYEELTLREISEVLGVTESRVCQLHVRALSRLRANLRGAGVSSAAA